MAENCNYPDKTTFKVKHLDEYHDIVIDWNDKRYEYKYQQVFDQLESITGVPKRYTIVFSLHRSPPTTLPDSFLFVNQIGIQGRRDISQARIRDGECFRLKCYLKFDWDKYNRICMNYMLVAEDGIPEGSCNDFFCQYKCNEAFFKNIKKIVTNDELNLKISQELQPVGRGQHLIAFQVFRKFNIRQFFSGKCEFREMRRGANRRMVAYPLLNHYRDYQRTRG